MAYRNQNRSDTTDRVPNYYSNNNLYVHSYQRNDYPTRISRRMHDGLSLDRNYGLDTTSDELNSSPYSSPYYVNGRYNSSDLTTQTGNSASVAGVRRLLSIYDQIDDFTDDDIQTYIDLWQGKQIKFTVPYTGKVVGLTIALRNSEGCHGILSIYLSAKDGGEVLAEASIDLCSVSQDNYEHRTLYLMTPVKRNANPRGELHVRMEIWDEIEEERSDNPFNSGRAIQVASTGASNHQACFYFLGEKNTPVDEKYEYEPLPSRPCLGLIYNDYWCIPTNRNEGVDYGASVSKGGYVYDLFTVKDENSAELVVYDRQTNQILPTTFPVDSRSEGVNLVQAEDYVYYVDGFSPLQRFHIGDWEHYVFPIGAVEDVALSFDQDVWGKTELAKTSDYYKFVYNGRDWTLNEEPVNIADYGLSLSGTPSLNAFIGVTNIAATETTPTEATATYSDVRPVVAPGLIIKHYNRIYLAGFRNDVNLVQYSLITGDGPDFNSYPYRFYAPDESPLATSHTPITSLVEYSSDTILITTTKGFSLYRTNADIEGGTAPQQVSTYSDGAGVAAAGDITNYRGTIYSFDPDEGIRRFNGELWYVINSQITSHIARVDMTKPRKIWGYAQKLYFNYTDMLDGKAKCLVLDFDMHSQQYPWFQDIDLPFCDARTDNDGNIIGVHPDFPCIMKLYDAETWHRLDTPITFERHTKYLALPGNATDMILKAVHNKVIANSDRWWWFGLSANTDTLEQTRGNDIWYRLPCWDTAVEDQPVETPFPTQDIYEAKAVAKLDILSLKMRAISVQEKIKCKTFRAQANLISTLFEAQARQYN